jgi:hypothetical protein
MFSELTKKRSGENPTVTAERFRSEKTRPPAYCICSFQLKDLVVVGYNKKMALSRGGIGNGFARAA